MPAQELPAHLTPGNLVYVFTGTGVRPAHVVSTAGQYVNVRWYGKLATQSRFIKAVHPTREAAVEYGLNLFGK